MEQLRGIILLATYSTDDPRDSGLKVLPVIGPEYRAINRDKYEAGKELLPENA